MPKRETVPVTMRALVQRINRKLAAKSEILKKARGEKAKVEAGDYYVINSDRNILMLKRVDPEALGRKLEVLRPWESVE